MKRIDLVLRRLRRHLMEGMNLNDCFQKEFYEIDLFVFLNAFFKALFLSNSDAF